MEEGKLLTGEELKELTKLIPNSATFNQGMEVLASGRLGNYKEEDNQMLLGQLITLALFCPLEEISQQAQSYLVERVSPELEGILSLVEKNEHNQGKQVDKMFTKAGKLLGVESANLAIELFRYRRMGIRHLLKSSRYALGVMASLTSYGTLELWRQSLESLPDEIGELSNLTSLKLDDNLLKELPESMAELEGLESLNLQNNKLKSIPEVVFKLKYLKALFLGGNKSIALNPELFQMQGLKYLSLENIRLSEVPQGLEGMKNLEYLNLSKNRLKQLPHRLLALSKLENLHIERCGLERIPDWIRQFPKLQVLYVGSQKLKQQARSVVSPNVEVFVDSQDESHHRWNNR